jgi:hypothetical protein
VDDRRGSPHAHPAHERIHLHEIGDFGRVVP